MPDRSAKAWAADGLPGWCQFEHDVDSWIAGIGMIGSENINRGVRERGRRHEIGFAVLTGLVAGDVDGDVVAAFSVSSGSPREWV